MFRQKNVLVHFIIFFVLINLVQAFFTELGNDEAYYWMYSQHLDWGYFDHPPMVAALIAMGYALLGNELGVRLFTVVMSAGTLALLWLLLPAETRKNHRSQWVFALLVASSPLINIYAFITTPDVPLIFFSVLFLFVYKRFLQCGSWGNAVWLGLLMGAMAYSKYHGALVVAFVLLSNPKLLLNPKIYVSGVIAAILLVPHLWWQYEHDFATFQYHLFSRNEHFNLNALLIYPVNVVLILNPFFVTLLFFKLFRIKSENSFERSLKVLFWGFILFFGFSAFKSHVEPHWIAIVVVPTIYFLVKIFQQQYAKYLHVMAWVSMGILLVARVALMLPLNIKSEFHGGKKRMKELATLFGDTPVAFTDGFQYPSKYNFYTGKTAFCYSSVYYRPTQYDYWNYEKALNGKHVYATFRPSTEGSNEHIFPSGKGITYKEFDDFHFVDKIRIEYPENFGVLKAKNKYKTTLTIVNPYDWDVDTQGDMPLSLKLVLKKNTHVKGVFDVDGKLPKVLKKNSACELPVTFEVQGLEATDYLMGFSIKVPMFRPFISSKWVLVEIQP